MDPWEALAVDDSVLKEFLERCNGNTTFIPGPAGHARLRARDFYTNAWTWAEKFIKHHGLVDDGDIKNITPLSKRKSMNRMAFVACVVKECKLNGLGDMLITIKDTTDTAKASLHNKVLSDREFGSDIGVGFVLLLKEVAIFRPFGYLNITLRNIVKVFKYDITHPTEEEVKTSMHVVRLNYVVKQNVEANAHPSINSNPNTNDNTNMGPNLQPNVEPTNTANVEDILQRMFNLLF
ncbi:hypothetical protein DEO72_LG8g1606 [Vigna unguiculata]|uniref:Homologous recombination OB-fold protein OB-fold domain-containing protein n=1 Tax=Vigna unguiculata TaxID=3917 RepID=A0A4D6MSG8_VIGUN|nr:hypothetical protein DEO72_LG8g1606 [Vigna unguiculata]